MPSVSKTACVAALGFFDGVHIGHQAVMATAVKRAGELGIKSCVFTFDIKPKDFIFNETTDLIIPDTKLKKSMILTYGKVDDVIFLHFDRQFANLTYQQFICDVLVKKYHVKHIVIGENFTCGKDGSGNAAAILALCLKLRIGCDVIKTVQIGGEAVSSTRIRNAIENNDIDTAKFLLGHGREN